MRFKSGENGTPIRADEGRSREPGDKPATSAPKNPRTQVRRHQRARARVRVKSPDDPRRLPSQLQLAESTAR
ncbi:MAG: hypothetical protein HY457_01765 [Parcubacteria group bacterium]|nr:hypothetical protein [Parcubacteria group bacterium]